MPTVLITGASTGIGRATALHFHSLGWRVYAGVRRTEDGEALVEATSDRLVPVELDVTNQIHVDALRALLEDQLEHTGLDGLVNNAGIGDGDPIEFIELDAVRRIFEVNLYGAIRCTQAFLPLLRVGVPGRIVNISSAGGRWAGPFMWPYHGSKWALESFSDSLRMELHDQGIEVCVVEPGTITTPIWDKANDKVEQFRGTLEEPMESLYGTQLRLFANVLRAQPNQGVPASLVAGKVEHALTAHKPKTRYVVGPDAWLITTLRWLLPDRAFESVVRSGLAHKYGK
jgi:NAD(P)-dependent dehydrogenase (short-subunit alcohol dehydrogenase family)